jgi:N-acetylmuramoyl-L-alanine amidase
MEIARKARADLFISIHADAFKNAKVKGASVYTISHRGASSEAARWLADRENAADLVGGVKLDDKDGMLASVLLDLSQTATKDHSRELANHVLKNIGRIGKLHKKTVQKAGFLVLKSPDIPSILIETAYISNPTEEHRLRNSRYQKKIAKSIYNGIVEYYQHHLPAGVRLAATRHTISRGDTLSGIALQYGVSMKKLQTVNKLPSKQVRIGQVLSIPRS